jgi:hypothetical protein
MAIFTLAEIENQITAYKDALLAISTGKEYAIGGKSMKREDLSEIRKTLEWLDGERQQLLSSSGTRMQVNIGMVRR